MRKNENGINETYLAKEKKEAGKYHTEKKIPPLCNILANPVIPGFTLRS